jgi:hypothetical protein
MVLTPHFPPPYPPPIVIKKLNKMTFVSDFPGFRQTKVKQNVFLALFWVFWVDKSI